MAEYDFEEERRLCFGGVNEQLEKRLKLKCKDIYICSRKGCFFCLLEKHLPSCFCSDRYEPLAFRI